jgi:phytol kinase
MPFKLIFALSVTFLFAIAWLRINDYLAFRGFISGQLSRKIIHIGTGPIYILCWLLFPDSQYSRYFAALVPLAITIQFLLVGLGVIKDQAAVDAMSRNGDRREILRGPLFYGIVFIILTIVYWYDSPTGIIALMLLCGGDGLADILGRRIKSPPILWSGRKSISGTLGMFFGGLVFALVMVALFVSNGNFQGPFSRYFPAILIIALVGTLVESLPFKDIDNLTVPLSAIILGAFLIS